MPEPSLRIFQRRLRARRASAPRAAGEDDIELAVFRFTLGIPGFDDALIPRVVGVLGLALLAVNHVMSGEGGSEVLVRC